MTATGKGLRGLVRELTPPALWRLAARAKPAGEWRYAGRDWPEGLPGWDVAAAAERAAGRFGAFTASLSGTGPLGLNPEADTPGAADYAAHNTVMCFAHALALAAGGSGSLAVLDWGGGLGHYHLLARSLYPDLALDWTVRELPAWCEHGARLQPALRFTSGRQCLGGEYGLVMASSSLQYSRDWRSDLAGLAGAARPWLFITRTPFVIRAASFVVVQSPADGVSYPGWFFNRAEVLDECRRLGFDLVREYLIDERPMVKGAPEQADYRGFLWRRAEDR